MTGWRRLTSGELVYVVGEASDTHVLVSNYRGAKSALVKKSDMVDAPPERLYPRASPLSRALREIAKGKRLSSLQVPVLDDAADHIEELEDHIKVLEAALRNKYEDDNESDASIDQRLADLKAEAQKVKP